MSDPIQAPSKKKLSIVRTIHLWASYDPTRHEIVSFHKYKYQVPVVPGRHVIRLYGHYVPRRK